MAENAIIWADIPVADLERAKKFYGAILGVPLMQPPGMTDIALIPPLGQPVEGQVVVSADLYVGKPSMEGCTIYLNTMGDINGMVQRVRDAGGEILQEPQDMGPMVGTIAFFKDSEGNRIGLQQQSPRK